MQHARTFLDEFVQHDNHQHHHAGIGLHTPADVHYRIDAAVTARRTDTLGAARAAHPERFTGRTDPKILDLPDAAWINPPIAPAEDQERETTATAA